MIGNILNTGLVAAVRECDESILPQDIRTLFNDSDSDLVVSAGSQRMDLADGAEGTTNSSPGFGNTNHTSLLFTPFDQTGYSASELEFLELGQEVVRVLYHGPFVSP
jgi:hypothetical protein